MRGGAGGREKIPGENERVRERERERGRRARRSSSRRRDEELTTGASERLEKEDEGTVSWRSSWCSGCAVTAHTVML